MLKFVSRCGRVGVAVASLTLIAGAGFVAGCDDQRAADKEVLHDIRQSRSVRSKGPEQAQAAQDLLNKAAGVQGGSAASKSHAKSLLAQAEVEAAISQINAPVTGVEAGNSQIAQLLYEIGSLAQQVRTSNSLVAAYRQYNPDPAKAMAQQQIASATGGADKAIWFGDQKNNLPSLTAVTQQIATLQGQIGRLQDQVKSLQAQQNSIQQQAEQAGRAAEAAQGQAGVDATKKAAGLRKQAADLMTQIDVLQAKIAPLQTDLAIAQARQSAIAAAVDQFKRLSTQYDEGWKGIEQQVIKQQQLATSVYQGVGASEASASTNSIASKSMALEKASKQSEEAFSTAADNLNNAITHFGEAGSAADQLQADLQTKGSDPSIRCSDLAKTVDAMKAAFNPNTFHLGQADAQQLLATLYTSRVNALAERARLVNDLRPVLKDAGLTMPKQLDDPKLDATIKDLAAKATEAYSGALETYGTIADAPMSTDAQKTASHIGRIFASYGRSQLARILNNAKDAATFLADARQARDMVIQEKSLAAIPALPSELVPPPATQASTAPTSGPSTTPATAAASIGTPASPEVTAAVKQAINEAADALTGRNLEFIKAHLNVTPQQQPAVDVMLSLVEGTMKLEAAMKSKWGENGAASLKQAGINSTMPDAEKLKKDAEAIEVRSTGADTVVLIDPKDPNTPPIPLKNVDGTWKVDFAGLDKTQPQMAAMLPMVTTMFKPMADGISQVAADVEAGKYQNPEEVKAALQKVMPPAVAAMMKAQVGQAPGVATSAPATEGAAPANPAAAAPGAEAGGAMNFDDDGGGFKFSVGPEWVRIPQAGEGAEGRKAFQLKAGDHGPGKAKAALIVQWMKIDSKEGPPPPKVFSKGLWNGVASQYQDIEKLEDQPAKLGGKDAWWFSFAGTGPNGMKAKGNTIGLAIPGEMVQIMFLTDPAAYDADAPLAKKVVDSVTWTR